MRVLGGVAMVYLLVLVIVGGANAGNQSLRVGHYRSLERCEAPQMKPRGLGSRREPLGSFACAPLVRPRLPPQDSCTFSQPFTQTNGTQMRFVP